MVWKESLGQEECGTRVERERTKEGNLKDSWSGEMGLSGTVRSPGVKVKAFYVLRISPTRIHFGIENRCPCPPYYVVQ